MANLPSFRQLEHLVMLADHSHFGRAAKACHVTQSTLSASIKELENVLQAPLVDRTKRRVVLTPLGRAAQRNPADGSDRDCWPILTAGHSAPVASRLSCPQALSRRRPDGAARPRAAGRKAGHRVARPPFRRLREPRDASADSR